MSQTIVLCHGVFDLLHSGHIEHLRQAKDFGDTLVVSVVPDKFVKKHKVIYNEKERLTLLRAVKYVDIAILCDGPGPETLLRSIHPHIYVRNDEYLKLNPPEYAIVKALGIATGFTVTIPPHTTEIVQRVLKTFKQPKRNI